MRRYLRIFLSLLSGTVLTPFLQAPAAKLAETIGFDTVYSSKWEATMIMASSWTHNPWYVAAASFITGAVITLWLFLLFPEKKESKVSNTAGSKAVKTRFEYDNTKPLKPIVGRRYRNEKVRLDGFHYIKCEIYNVTFVYDGLAGIGLQECSFTGSWAETNNISIDTAWLLIRALGFMREDIAIDADSGLKAEAPRRFSSTQPKDSPKSSHPTPTPPTPPATR